MSVRRFQPRDWSKDAEALLAALVEALGQPQGERGRSTKAFRQAARRLATAGVVPEALDQLLRDFAVETLRETGPMPIAAFLSGRLRPNESMVVICSRWPNGCTGCSEEIARGALCWYRRAEDDVALLFCSTCVHLDPTWERSTLARRRAIEKDDDPDSLLAAILAHTPGDHRAEVEDDLTLRLEAGRG